jgi:hypothetical protein
LFVDVVVRRRVLKMVRMDPDSRMLMVNKPFETLSPVFVMSSLKRFRRTVAHLRSPSSEK